MTASIIASLTPPELARRWRVAPEKIVVMIRKGVLHGFDVSTPGSRRPRYRVNISEVISYEERRSAAAPVKAVRRKRKKQTENSFVKYF